MLYPNARTRLGQTVADREQASFGGESPKERVERLLGEGTMPRRAVEQAERLWRERLQHGVEMPNGEIVRITRNDLYHAIIDPRIWRHPERIALAIAHVFEIRALKQGRRQALSRWNEGGQELLAVVILEGGPRLWSMHVINEKRVRRYNRAGGEVLWKQSERP
ncbi:MAG: hypothetical protein HY691_15010 [Chloroflexi bacterium]|nr:hypothetical protein [Chloroflexota bacterium]